MRALQGQRLLYSHTCVGHQEKKQPVLRLDHRQERGDLLGCQRPGFWRLGQFARISQDFKGNRIAIVVSCRPFQKTGKIGQLFMHRPMFHPGSDPRRLVLLDQFPGQKLRLQFAECGPQPIIPTRFYILRRPRRSVGEKIGKVCREDPRHHPGGRRYNGNVPPHKRPLYDFGFLFGAALHGFPQSRALISKRPAVDLPKTGLCGVGPDAHLPAIDLS